MPIDNVVSATAATPPPATTTTTNNTTPATGTEDFTSLRTELAELRGQVSEQQRTAEYWMERALRKEQATPAAEEPEEEVDVLDVLTTQGAKGLDAILAKRGYARLNQVDERVNNRATQLLAEQKLQEDYPDLKDYSSDFFKSTSQHYGRLVREGVPEKTAMRLAAQAAELEGIKSGKRKTPQQSDDAATRERERQARIRAQAGDRSPRASEPEAGGEGDDELTDNEKHICRAMGISEEAYKKRAQQGVQMYSGRGRK